MTQPCRPTAAVRFTHTSELSLKRQLVSRMARLLNAVVFLPTETLLICQRAREVLTYSFCRKEKRSCNCILVPLAGGAAFIPLRSRMGLSPRFGNTRGQVQGIERGTEGDDRTHQ
jgi:hypothetical protein